MLDEEGKEEELDLIFHPNFRRGHFGEMDELKRERKNATKNMKAYSFGGDNTDWKVNAVVDEDELKKGGVLGEKLELDDISFPFPGAHQHVESDRDIKRLASLAGFGIRIRS